MRRLISGFVIVLACCAGPAEAAGPAPVWTTSGFAQPASAVYAADKQVIYVSNIDGDPSAKDGKGFISRLSADGTLIKREVYRGLNAPKGLAYRGGYLYVADLDELVQIDTGNGRITQRYRAAGAKNLHDVAADAQGRVYVTDPATNAIWRLSGQQFSVWVQDAALNGPTGVSLEKGRVVGSSAGAPGDGGAKGYLISIDPVTRAIEPRFAPLGFGSLDGVVADVKGGYYVSDGVHGNVYHVSPTGENNLWLLLEPGLADLALLPGKRLVVLNTEAGTLSAFALQD